MSGLYQTNFRSKNQEILQKVLNIHGQLTRIRFLEQKNV